MASYDFGSALGTAATGAATGSLFGAPGTIAGAGLGFVSGLFGSKKKKKKKPKPISTLDPQQQGLYDEYVNGLRGQGPMAGQYNFDANAANQNFDLNYSRPAYRNFRENIIPDITSQFRNRNTQNSSYAGQALARAGRDVQESLDAQRSNYLYQGEQNAFNRRQKGVENALGTTTFDYQTPAPQQKSGIDQILNSLGPAAGEWLKSRFSQMYSGTQPPTNPGPLGA